MRGDFWSKVQKTKMCWNWIGATHWNGYGMVYVGKLKRRAHHIAWTLVRGPIPEGVLVLHKCDNPRCVNPDHLFLGTAADNMRDKTEKGRATGQPPGEGHSMAKLTSVQVVAMRRLYSTGEWTQRQLAETFHISKAQAGRVVAGLSWSKEVEG